MSQATEPKLIDNTFDEPGRRAPLILGNRLNCRFRFRLGLGRLFLL